MQVTEYLANQTERMAESMAHFISVTDPEKLNWKPELPGSAGTRTALQQVTECVEVNLSMAKLFRGEDLAASPANRTPPDIHDSETARHTLLQSAYEFASVLRNLDDSALDKIYHHPRGEILGHNMIIMALRNMAYHSGQINMIQMLYGDAEFHVPPNWR